MITVGKQTSDNGKQFNIPNSKFNIDIVLPKDWPQLTDRQARTAIRLLYMPTTLSSHEALTLCALRFSGIRLLHTTREGALLRIPIQHSKFKIRNSKLVCEFPYSDLTMLTSEMRWMLEPPRRPWRPSRLCRATPTAADLSDLTFGQFMQAEALYQGYINKKDPAMMIALADIMIPRRHRKPRPWEKEALMIWFASAKTALTLRFPNLFRPAGNPDGQGSLAPQKASLQKAFDAQLRALTKGDPLKEDRVLALPLLRALTELDAQAAEYADIRARIKK